MNRKQQEQESAAWFALCVLVLIALIVSVCNQ